MSGKFKTLRPEKVTPDILRGSNVPENDAPLWVTGTNYTQFAEVIYNHFIYVDGVGGVSAKSPELEPTRWSMKNPTNRWRIFDDRQLVHTKQGGHIWYEFVPGVPISGILPMSLRNVDYYTVTMRDPNAPEGAPPLYSRSFTFGLQPSGTTPYHYFNALWVMGEVAPAFDDLPSYPDAILRVDFFGGADMEIGPICFGEIREWGEGVEMDPELDVDYFSTEKEDDYGMTKRVKRGWRSKASLSMIVDNRARSEMRRYFISIRDEPCVLIVSERWDDTRFYGTMKFKERITWYDRSRTSITLKELPNND